MYNASYFKALRCFIYTVLLGVGTLQLRAQVKEPDAAEVQKATLLAVVKNLKENHVRPKAIDNDFSKKVWKKYLEGLDPNKDIFLKSDFEALRPYEFSIDDELNEGSLTFFNASFELYQKRLSETVAGYRRVLAQPFDFTRSEFVQFYGKMRGCATTQAELNTLWERRAKYLVLRKMMDLDKNKMSSPTLEKEARAKVDRWIANTFRKLTGPSARRDKFSQFLNTVTLEVEPHTTYFPPVQVKNIDARMAKRFFGVGLQLQDKEGDANVKDVRPGGAAMKSGKIEPGDCIVGVSNAAGQMIDVVGISLIEITEMIKGEKDTEVSLALLKPNGQQKTVVLKRAEINEEEGRARSAIILKGARKIGYLYLSEFYVDASNPNGVHAAIDVQTELMKLKAAKVDGIVFDLRNNPGGSMDEVVDIAGFFLGPGPKVLVKDIDTLYTPTTNAQAIYTGPLVVMINENSASASELFAAAIQDHKRGLIVGAPASFGKGTAQPTLPLGKVGNRAKGIPSISYGSLRISQYQFYRVTGASTQLRGVASDIVLPGKLAYMETREKFKDSALPWDSIPPANYKPFNTAETYRKMRKLGREVIGELNAFKIIEENSKLLAEQQLRSFNLKATEFVKQQQVLEEYVRKIDDASRLPVTKQLKVIATPGFEGTEKEWYGKWAKELSKDIYIDKTLDIINGLSMFK